MKITALAPWFGSNRMLAAEVGKALDGCEWVGVVFAGGMAELPHITVQTIVVNDLHKHVMNLARVAAGSRTGPALYRRLRRLPFHPMTLGYAQGRCREIEEHLARASVRDLPAEDELVEWAECYFVCAWMARNGTAGTSGEFNAGPSFRWEAGGGDSAVRFSNAVFSLRDWRRILARCTFDCRDWREFLKKCKDRKGHGVYCDPPFPGPGDGYKHTFGEQDHAELAAWLANYRETRVVCRFYDHSLVRKLYPEHRWRWRHLVGQKATNAATPEVLIDNAV